MDKKDSTQPVIVAQIMGKWVGGGVESVIMNYYRHIDRSKIQFDFICDEDSTRIPYEEIKKLGGRVFLVPKYQKLPNYLKALEKLFKENKYRIVHANINTLSVFPLYTAKKAGVPVRISHSHSTSNIKEWKRNLIKNLLRPFSKRYATDYFACSVATGLYQFGKRKSSLVKIVPNSIDIEQFKFNQEDRRRIRDELGIAKSTIVIGHIGRFVETKNHQFIIRSFLKLHQKNSDTKLVLIGDGPLLAKTKKLVRDLALNDSVFFLGRRDDIAPYYSAFDIFFLPSLYEGMPMSGIEAQVSGLKCVFSDCFSKDTAITDNVLFLSNKDKNLLIDSVEHFSKYIYKRGVLPEDVTKVDIENNVSILQSIYCRPTKIIHLISTDSFSGAENVACQIINMFEGDQKYEMKYCTKLGKNRSALKMRNIPILEVKKFSFFPLMQTIRKYNPDIIHAHDPKASFYASILFPKTKIISHVHSNHKYMRKKSLRSVIFRLIANSKLNKIIWVSDSAYQEYIFKDNIKNKSIILYNAVDVQELKNLAKLDKREYKFDLIFLARLEDVKDPLRFIRIVGLVRRQIPKIKVAIVGDGSLMGVVKEKVAKYKLQDNIKIFGNLENPYKVLMNSKALVITSKFEGTPMNALEAISFGIPVISTPVDGLKKILTKTTGVFCESDFEFSEQIVKQLKSKGEKRKEPTNNDEIIAFRRMIQSLYRDLTRW